MTDTEEPADRKSESVDSTSYSGQARTEKPLHPFTAAFLQPRVFLTYVNVFFLSLMLGLYLSEASDMSNWVFIGYVHPMVFWLIYLVTMPEVERILAIREGRHHSGTRNPWHGFWLKHARIRRISPFRGRMYLASVLSAVCVTLVMLTLATTGLVEYATGSHDPAPRLPPAPPDLDPSHWPSS